MAVFGIFLRTRWSQNRQVWGGPASAVVSNLLPAGMQGTGFAVYFSVSTLIGAGGPEILGLILQKFTDTSKVTDTKTYITAFMIVATFSAFFIDFLTIFCYFLGYFCYFWGFFAIFDFCHF
jgi:hypothetical protein